MGPYGRRREGGATQLLLRITFTSKDLGPAEAGRPRSGMLAKGPGSRFSRRRASPGMLHGAYPLYRFKFENTELTSIAKEPRRDWSLGFITGHRARLAISILFIILISSAWSFISPSGPPPTKLFDEIWSWSSLLWLSGIVPGTVGLLGAFAYRHPST